MTTFTITSSAARPPAKSAPSNGPPPNTRRSDFFPSVRLALHRHHPRLVVNIPLHRFPNSGLKRMCRHPAELVLDLRRVNRVTPVMTRTVFHVGDQLARIS